MTLFSYLESTFNDINKGFTKNTFGEVIVDDKESVTFISAILNDERFISGANDVPTSQTRSRHSLITYLMGIPFSSCFGLNEYITNTLGVSFSNFWLFTSLYHDYGYFSKYIKDETFTIDNLQHNILDDSDDHEETLKNVLSLPVEEIKQYDQYAREYHKNNGDDEKVDHGILGGALMYDRLTKKGIDNTFLKTVGLTIAQHNIYKSENIKTDISYRKYGLTSLLSVSDWKITTSTPLLLFLSLIDTVECIKRFSKSHNKNDYVESKTVLNNISVDLTNDSIVIDYEQLIKLLEKKAIDYSLYISGVLSINSWTSFTSTPMNTSNSIIKISLDERKED